MTKKADFVKGLHGMSDTDLQARLSEDKLRLKKLNLRMQFLHWKTQ
jgi:hypothetical protein